MVIKTSEKRNGEREEERRADQDGRMDVKEGEMSCFLPAPAARSARRLSLLPGPRLLSPARLQVDSAMLLFCERKWLL